MASIGKTVAPTRFIAFLLVLALAVPAATYALGDPALGAMTGFDVAGMVFLLSCLPLLGISDPALIRDHANANDANRAVLLGITGVVMVVLLISVAAETVGERPPPFTKAIVIATLIVA